MEIVSAGSTDTYEVTGSYPGITEIEPGSFVFGAGPEGSGYGWSTNNNVYFKSSLTVLSPGDQRQLRGQGCAGRGAEGAEWG